MRAILLLLLFFLMNVFPAIANNIIPYTINIPNLINQPKTKEIKKQLSKDCQRKILKSIHNRHISLEPLQYYKDNIEYISNLVKTSQKTLADIKNNKIHIHQVNLDNIKSIKKEILFIENQISKERFFLQKEYNCIKELNTFIKKCQKYITLLEPLINDNNTSINNITSESNILEKKNIYNKIAKNKAKINKLYTGQLSASLFKKLVYIYILIHQHKTTQLENYLLTLKNNIAQYDFKINLTYTNEKIKNLKVIPFIVEYQRRINQGLLAELSQQIHFLKLTVFKQNIISTYILKIREVLSILEDESQWTGDDTDTLSIDMRSKLTEIIQKPEINNINNLIKKIRIKCIFCEELTYNKTILTKLIFNLLNKSQIDVLVNLTNVQKEMLNSLITRYKKTLFELLKMRYYAFKFRESVNETKNVEPNFFWMPDINSIGIDDLNIINEIFHSILNNKCRNICTIILVIFHNIDNIFLILINLLLYFLNKCLQGNYKKILEKNSSKVGKVTQDKFYITINTALYSMINALPIPIYWLTLGYILQNTWPWLTLIAVGQGIIATVPLLIVSMIIISFSSIHGIFISHFKWPQTNVLHIKRCYSITISIIVPLIALLIGFNNSNQQMASSLGRLCFIFICIAMSLIAFFLKREQIPLYLNRHGLINYPINNMLWNIMIILPQIASYTACMGYFSTAQAILIRLETSVAIWLLLLVIYYIIRRWMLIKCRRIAFDRARQRRADILATRARNEEDKELNLQNLDTLEIEEPVINIDIISAQSLRLVRSFLKLIAIISVIGLWSEIHSAFDFLGKIHLWDTTRIIQGIENIHSITLGAVMLSIVVFVITTQIVRDFPALLEIAVLQNIKLTPGTSYAITTITKYFLMIIGNCISFSLLGIDWSKLQWLIAALGVGLGFGLQEIFANFISGLIILFEKPIRIGDTVTIRNLTGSITHINIRATTIRDWDRKEIIVPNKAFITEQFVNWSLSDSVTRIVVSITASTEINSEKVTRILKQAAQRCNYVLSSPTPEVYLVDLQQGIQIFELRIYAAEMKHRMPLRHELHQSILQCFKENGIEIPFPSFQVRIKN
ncbi:miniconductance mechanosensitive channel MscM [Candidatus Ishikawella capsulata]|uniref:Predicted mechanosensitive channel n=1 Tax=Candidatus Ishikawaella capsulata Mpkobe TaxID=476281 RepID=C5WCI7_9ENTR|nr:miniconductance mechanosensitive channel MscM [Candidatus Ishikawaella capsulata]BAH83043.1 predicted mechanosensitive channel [Candidatus Ishikawaella capsulata Mpkobe]